MAHSATLDFEHLGRCFYKRGEFRPPQKFEYYLSGAIVQAYRAPNNLTSAYQIVTPTHHAQAVTGYERGAAVSQLSFNARLLAAHSKG